MMKRLTKHGNSRAIVVDRAILEAAGISENALFQTSVNPSGGLVIQSVEDNNRDVFRENFEKLKKSIKNLCKTWQICNSVYDFSSQVSVLDLHLPKCHRPQR